MIHLRIVSDMASRNLELRKLLNQIFYSHDTRVCLHGQTWTPQMDVYETPEAYMILAEMPGLEASDIDLVVDPVHVQISGCRSQPTPPASQVVHQTEISYGRFERAFKLPGPIRPEQAEASLDNGYLRIVLPKDQQSRSRIAIR